MNATGQTAGAVLGILMERARISPARLAEVAHVSKQTVHNKLRGQAWGVEDMNRYAQVFDVPVELFLRAEVDAMLWLIENDRFNLEVIDLRDTSDQGISGSPCSADRSPFALALTVPGV